MSNVGAFSMLSSRLFSSSIKRMGVCGYHSIAANNIRNGVLIKTSSSPVMFDNLSNAEKGISIVKSAFKNVLQVHRTLLDSLHGNDLEHIYRIITLRPTICDSSGEVDKYSPGTHIATCLANIKQKIELITDTNIDLVYDRDTVKNKSDALIEGNLYKGQNFCAKAMFRDVMITYPWMFMDSDGADGVTYFAFIKFQGNIDKEKERVNSFRREWLSTNSSYDRLTANCCHPLIQLLMKEKAERGITPQSAFCQLIIGLTDNSAKPILRSLQVDSTPYERGAFLASPSLTFN